MSTANTTKQDAVIGHSVVDIRRMTEAELSMEGWDASPFDIPTCLVFDNGTKLYASRDAEGNGPGVLFGTEQRGRTFLLMEHTEVNET